MHSSIFKVVNDQWDAHFISSLNETDFEDLLISAHYLNIDCILDLCLAKLACEMYELNAGQVETRFGLPPLQDSENPMDEDMIEYTNERFDTAIERMKQILN